MNCVDAGNVFVHLFSQTKTRYILTNKKLQYLLIIAQMAQLACSKTLFDDDIRNFKNGFVLDSIADNFVSSAAIVNGISKNMPIEGEFSDFVLPYSNKKIFRISNLPTEEEKRLLIKVFLSFGAYSEEMLGYFLNGFRPLRDSPSFKVVSKKRIRSFLLDAVAKGLYANNALFEFIKTEYTESKSRMKKPAQQVQVAAKAEAKSKEIIEETFASGILKDLASLRAITVGKKYSVLVEVPSSRCSCQVSVKIPSLDLCLPGVLEKVTSTLYRYTFDGVAADIKVSTQITRCS